MYISQSHKCVTKGKHIYRKTAAHAKSCPCLGDPSCFILVMFQQWNKNKRTSSKVFVKGSGTERYISKQGLVTDISRVDCQYNVPTVCRAVLLEFSLVNCLRSTCALNNKPNFVRSFQEWTLSTMCPLSEQS